MNRLRWFLSWSYKNANDSRKLRLRRRMLNIHNIDTEMERGFCMLKMYTKYGKYWYNCVTSPERLWWIGEEGEA